MSSTPADSLTSYLPTDIIVPSDANEQRIFLEDFLRKMVDAVNDKEIAHYNTVEGVTGQKWFNTTDPQKLKNTYRKVVNFGALPNTVAKSVAHGITTNANTRFTQIYGCATDPAAATTNRAIPIPYIDPAALINGVQIYVDATNVVITTAANYAAYSAFVILEYLQF